MLVNNKQYHTIWLENNIIKIIDQRKLPYEFAIEELKTVDDVFVAIKDMHARGAPLIGVAAAYGMYLACLQAKDDSDIKKYAEHLRSARPTAIDLMWAVDTMLDAIKDSKDKLKTALETANTIKERSIDQCRMIGLHGYKIIEGIYKNKNAPVNILTHCNAGWLATVDYGTATSPMYLAHEKGIPLHVWVDETRPRNQGYLTAWELGEQGVPHTVIVDNAGGHLMQKGMVDIVVVGSDRTTLTGDVTNKIGTYLKALAARDNNIPFYVALPSSSIEWAERDHRSVPIEERSSDEVDCINGADEKNSPTKIRVMPKGSKSSNYAFDVTPARLVTGLITERGICKASKEDILRLFPEKRQ